jgi:hypothetical protein
MRKLQWRIRARPSTSVLFTLQPNHLDCIIVQKDSAAGLFTGGLQQ